MKFLLTSAGITNKYISDAITDLAGKPSEEINFLFVPTAANLESGDKGWLIDNLVEFKKQNFKTIDIVDIAAVPAEIWKHRFEAADVICFGGGNEQYLAKIFDNVGMKEYLSNILKEKVYVGISAGSMVVGQFIAPELMKVVYPEEVYPKLADSLAFVDFCFIPHLNSEWFTHVRNDVLAEVKDQVNAPIYAFDDETALKVVDGHSDVVGIGEFWGFER
ncbi:MAG: peptidase E [Candidatus Pacebacteria bacterium]|nr:peptidase E [Candidatus Paceibacterota bacterium]